MPTPEIKISDEVLYGSAPIPHVLQFKLWSQVKVADMGRYYQSCWNFTGKKAEGGHGYFSHRKQTYFAHRVAYEQATGHVLTETEVVRHKCDNPACCNPLHLETGTQVDNNLDMLSRGRNPKGATHGMATITETQVREIRWLYATAGGVRGAIKAIATRMKLNKQLVAYVTQRNSWAELPNDFDTLVKPVPLSPEELHIERTIPNRGGSELTPEKVQRIRALREAGATLPFISNKFGGVAWSGLSNICNRNTWADVPVPETNPLTPEEIEEAKRNGETQACTGEGHHAASVTTQQVREMRWLAQDYEQRHASKYGVQQAVATRYGISKAIANQVLSRRSWTSVPDDFDTLVKPAPLEKLVITRTRLTPTP